MIISDKLNEIVVRYEEIMNELSDASVGNDPSRLTDLMKEQA